MNWIKENWIWLACIGVGAAGLYFFSKPSNPGAEFLEKARRAKAENDAIRKAEADAADSASVSGHTDNGQAVSQSQNA